MGKVEQYGRRKLTAEERWTVYNRMGGRCAYCGKEITYHEMQVDHVKPLRLGGADELENMMPACRACNHYKRGNSLEGWRRILEATPATLDRDSYTYRQAVRFGLVTPTPHKVVFFFEKEERDTDPVPDILMFIGRFSTDGWETRREVIEAFTQGCCYWFAYILVARFGEQYGAEIVIDFVLSHFAARIAGRVYDITGDVTDAGTWEPWETYADTAHKERIAEQCIMF